MSSACCQTCRGPDGRPKASAIFDACAARHDTHCVTCILAHHPAAVQRLSSNGKSPLRLAAEANRVDAIEQLVAHGARIENGWVDERPLICAVRAGKLAAAEALVRAGARANGDVLIAAARTGNARLCALVLQAGATLRPSASAYYSHDDENALQVACSYAAVDVVRLLLAHEGGAALVAATPASAIRILLPEGVLHVSDSPLSFVVQSAIAAVEHPGRGPPQAKLTAAATAERRAVECAQALFEAGAAKHLVGADVNLLVLAARLGLPRLTRLLAAHGASRKAIDLCRGPSSFLLHAQRTADGAATAACADARARQPWFLPTAQEALDWLKATQLWATQLHHLTELAPAKVGELLRARADVHSRTTDEGAPSPLSLAEQILADGGPGGAGAALVCAAARSQASNDYRWSTTTHALCAPAVRAHAAFLLRVGYRVVASIPAAALRDRGRELLDVWVGLVMPFTLPAWTDDALRAGAGAAGDGRGRRGRRGRQRRRAGADAEREPSAPLSALASAGTTGQAAAPPSGPAVPAHTEPRFAPGTPVVVRSYEGAITGAGGRRGRVVCWIPSSLRYQVNLHCQTVLATPSELLAAPPDLSREPMPPPDDLPDHRLDAFGEPLPNRRSEAWRNRFGASARPLLYGVHIDAVRREGAEARAPLMTLRTRLFELCELAGISRLTDDDGVSDRLALPHELDCMVCVPHVKRTYGYWGIVTLEDAALWRVMELELLADVRRSITRKDLDFVARQGYSGSASATMQALAEIAAARQSGGLHTSLERFYPEQQ
jgi:hypothetical protein